MLRFTAMKNAISYNYQFPNIWKIKQHNKLMFYNTAGATYCFLIDNVGISQVALVVKKNTTTTTCLPMQETQEAQILSRGQVEHMEEGTATPFSILAWTIPMDRGTWWVTVHRTAKSQTRLKWLSTQNFIVLQTICGLKFILWVKRHWKDVIISQVFQNIPFCLLPINEWFAFCITWDFSEAMFSEWNENYMVSGKE